MLAIVVFFAVIIRASVVCVFVGPAAATTSSYLQGKLVFAHILFRHGDRTPVDPYPNDPYGDPKYWSTGWGQLTNLGKRQHFELGKWLRRRYNSLLNETYSDEQVYIQSTDVDRTLMSALANLAGMFPPKGKDVWSENLAWQPIPVHTIPEVIDAVLANKKPCPAYDHAMSELLQTDYFQGLDERFASLYDYLTNMTGRLINTPELASKIYDTFFIEESNNLTLPAWTKKIYPSEDMDFLAKLAFVVDTFTRPLARLKAGPLLKDILDRFIDKSNNSLIPNRSVWIYSAHDTTIANILNTLGVFEAHRPPYCSCVMMEMRLIEDIPYISVFYRNTTAEPQLMNIPGCGTQCSLKNMFQLYKDVLPVDWDTECEMSIMSLAYEDANLRPAVALFACGSLISLAMILIYVTIVYYRRRQYFDYQWYMQVQS